MDLGDRRVRHLLGGVAPMGVMTEDERRYATSRAMERDEVRTAIAKSSVSESISRKLGDDLIDACRELVGAWYERSNSEYRMAKAVNKIEELVGKP
jgi:hypothetical protein